MHMDFPLDEQLLADAMAATGLESESEVIELGLRTILRLAQMEETRQYRSRLSRQDVTDSKRRDRPV